MRKLAFCALFGLGLGGCQPLVQVEASPEDLSELEGLTEEEIEARLRGDD